MSIDKFIPVDQLCAHYKVEMSFFTNLNDFGLIHIKNVEKSLFVHQDQINEIEKMIRMHQDLNINLEGIDAVFNLLEKINDLQQELIFVKDKLKLYEGDNDTI